MQRQTRFFTAWTIGILIFLSVFLCCSLIYIRTAREYNSNLNKNHALIIAHDLWNLNDSGMRAYLHLATQTNNYKNLRVITEEGELFLDINGPEIRGVDKFFFNMGLIPIKKSVFPIYYTNDQIGTLHEEQYIRYIYPLFTIFLIQFFLVLTGVFIFYLIFNRKLLEKQVIERTKKYHELVNLLPEMVLETNADGIIVFANKKAQISFGLKNLLHNKYDCRDYLLLKDGQHIAKQFLQPMGENLEEKEFLAKRADNSLFPVLIRSAPIYTEGTLTGARLVIVDITERSALEEQLNRDQKMKSIGLMAGGVAHDLNNILSGIVNYPELMIQQVPENSPLLKKLIPMKEAGLRAAAVVADLLTVARGVAAVKESTNLNQLITDYMGSPEFTKLQSIHPDIEYLPVLDQNIDNINCSAIHVKKCLMNLVTNGSEAVSGAGQVIVSTTRVQVDTETAKHDHMASGTYTVMTVQDTGSGISKEDIEHIFEPFYSKKALGRSGTGLGLAVVWNTMQDHRGNIKVIPQRQGTSFELYFPISEEQVKRDISVINEEHLYTGNGESILILDDEKQQRDIASQLLTSLGYRAHTVSSGEAAIEITRKEKFDLILLDMVLGSGLNGQQTYEEIIKIHPNQKAIISSGFSESNDVRKTMTLGAGSLINKPYTREQLAKAVHHEINSP